MEFLNEPRKEQFDEMNDYLSTIASKIGNEDLQAEVTEHKAEKVHQVEVHGIRTTDDRLEFFNGTEWKEIEGGSTGSPYPVRQPTNFQGLPDDGQVNLSWVNPSDLIVKDLDDNNITLAEFDVVEVKRDGVIVYEGALESYTDTGLNNNQEYTYEIVSITKVGVRSGPVTITATPIPFTMDLGYGVTNAQISIGDTSLTLTYTNPTEDDLAGILIRRSTISHPTAIDEGTEVYKGLSETVTDVDLTNGQEYFYTIWAYNTSNQYSDELNKVEISGTPVPFTVDLEYNVTDFILQAGDGQITGTWVNSPESDFEGVLVRASNVSPPTIYEGDIVYNGALETFTEMGLTNGTERFYSIWAYNNDNQYSATVINASVTPKGTQSAPSAPSMNSRTDTSITLNVISGAVYRKNGGTWQESTTFSGLDPGNSYDFQAKLVETDYLFESEPSPTSSITTNKGTQSAPSAPSVSNVEYDRATVSGGSGTQVRLNSGSWFDSPNTFTGLTEETTYTAYARYKETSTHYASPSSSGNSFTTPSDTVLQDISGSPGGDTTIAATDTAGFFGEVTTTEFGADHREIDTLLGLSAGTPQNDTEPFIKFIHDGKIKFIPKKSTRNDLSWDDINIALGGSAGGAPAEKIITVGDYQYKARFMRGAGRVIEQGNGELYTDSYADADRASIWEGVNGSWNANSENEWNTLILPLHTDSDGGGSNKNNFSHPDYAPDNVPDWASYTDEQLNVVGDGRIVWCAETRDTDTSRRVIRGISGSSDLNAYASSYAIAAYGLRLVLELL